ncbi:MAG: serine/threonine-protein kinase [Planctomycetota bacterium]
MTSPLSRLAESVCQVDQKLLEVLESYLELRELGDVDHEAFLRRHPSLAERLGPLIASLDALEELNASGPLDVESLTEFGWKDLTAQTLGDFEIVREVGRGGMGVVYEARQLSLDRTVALKVLPLSVVLDETKITRFMIEAQSAAQLHHPHIVPIYSVGCEDGTHCYSMLFIDGDSLDTFDFTRTNTSLRQRVTWIEQVARALEHAHERGVIHRDIKPSNLMVDRAEKVWVTDFGLARFGSDSSLTESGAVVGTLRYMSPEQACGQPHLVDHHSDIYSLGLTLYEIVTGEPAFPKSTAVARDLIHGEPRAPRRVNPNLPRDLETIILKSIAIEPERRYNTAALFADDLRRFLDGRAIRAARPSTVDRIAKWTYRHRRMVTISVTALLVAFLASLGTVALFANTQRDLRLAIASKNKQQREAKEHFRRTREVLDRFGLLVAEELGDVPGAAPIRKEMVRDLLEYYQEFVVGASATPELREELAQTHFRAARVIEEMGGKAQAIKAYEQAVSLYEAILHQNRDGDTKNRLQLAVCHNNLGLLNAELGNFAMAHSHYTIAIEQLDGMDRPDSAARRELAGVYGNLGLLLSATDDRNEAARALETAHALLSSGAGARDLQWRLAAAMTLNNLGFLYQATDQDESLRYNQQAIEILRALADESEKASVIRALATSLNNQASLFARSGRRQESLDAYREAIRFYRKLVNQSRSLKSSEELAICYNNVGRLLTQMSRFDDAEVALEAARFLLKKLCDEVPSESRYRVSLGGVLNNLAKRSMLVGDIERALESYRESLGQQQGIPATLASHASSQDMLHTTYANYEAALRTSGDIDEANRIHQQRTVR